MEVVSVFTPERVRTVLAACAPFCTESEFVSLDLDQSTFLYTRLIQRHGGAVFGLFDGGVCVGGLGAVLGPDLHSGARMAIETFWFVDRAHRGEGIKLLDAFEGWGASMGCAKLAMVHLVDSMPQALEKFYLRRGYRLAELHYLKEV